MGVSPLILALGIETSCDETAASVVEGGRMILSSIVASSLSFHKKYGGVVPEIACRAHVEVISVVIQEALEKAGCGIDDIGLVAVTEGPGLVGALMVGVAAAKGICFTSGLPLVGVNHLKAHVYANFLVTGRSGRGKTPGFPFVALVISGGHTCLLLVKDFDDFRVLGETTDDAAGEAFDKVARVLGLGYPGGPAIDSFSRKGDPGAISFTRPHVKKRSLDFSFSGIKTQVLYYHQGRSQKAVGTSRKIEDMAAGFQEAMVDAIVEKTKLACSSTNCMRVVVGGGVALNSRLRSRLSEEAGKERIELFLPDAGLCSDNAAMIAGLGTRLFEKGVTADMGLSANPALRF